MFHVWPLFNRPLKMGLFMFLGFLSKSNLFFYLGLRALVARCSMLIDLVCALEAWMVSDNVFLAK